MPRQQKKEYKPGTILNNRDCPGYFIMILNKKDCIALTKGLTGPWQPQEWRADILNKYWFIVQPKR